MTTPTEKVYQAALLADAAYVTFNKPDYLEGDLEWQNPAVRSRLREDAYPGTSSPDDVPFGEVTDGRGWTQSQFDQFANRYRVVYHQPDLANGFSATLFYDTVLEKHTVAFRGTNEIPFPDLTPADLWLALGISSAIDGEQHNSIAGFFEAAGLIDSSGEVNAAFAGQVDFVGHSLGGYLSLWGMYQFRELFAEVYTYNGAGISAIPGTPDYAFIENIVAANPLTSAQQSRIHNFFAEEGVELVANDTTFFRPGEREGLFVERKDLLGSGLFHSVSLLVESLSVYRLFALVDENLDFEAAKNILYAMSNESPGTLDRAVAALSDLLGEGYEYSGLDDAEPFYQDLSAALGEQASLGGAIESLADNSDDAILAAARADSAAGRGYRYALDQLLPFALTSGHQGTAIEDAAYDPDQFSDRLLQDRTLMLTTLLRMNSADGRHGDLSAHMHFADLEQGIAFNSDAISYGDGSVSDLRARLVFGSDADDATTIEASSQDDSLYGMAGNDIIQGLEGSDHIEGGAGDDVLSGGAGVDYLTGGQGSDTFAWDAGDGDDVIIDFDDGGDRIVVNGTDLATLRFARAQPGSPYYGDPASPGITLRYDGDALAILVGSGPDRGTITATGYSPLTGADYGIVLDEQGGDDPAVTNLAVTLLGTGSDETDPSAYWRQQSAQGGLDWAAVALRFDATAVANYSGGALHGTLGGAFEGGPLADYLSGDADANALHGLAGADLLEGAAGDDFLEGGAGSDRIDGGDGGDIIFGDSRAALAAGLDPNNQRDQFYLAQALDSAGDINLLSGGAGADLVSGGRYTDIIDGGAGMNQLFGGTGQDLISGGEEQDTIYGDSALAYAYVELSPGVAGEQLAIVPADGADGVGLYDDEILAGAGDDTVRGELGNDRLHGGPGNDLLLGGAGDDSYYFRPGDGLDYIEDEAGAHTLVFGDIDTDELQVRFQGDQVQVGSGFGAEGFHFSVNAWPDTRIALDAPEAVIERSQLDTLYYDTAGNLLLRVAGTNALTEAEREALFTVDTTDPDKPRIFVRDGADSVEIEALAGGSDGAIMRITSGLLQLTVELAVAQLATGLDFLELVDGVTMSLIGFAGNIHGSSGADMITGSGGADDIYGGGGNDVIEGRGGDDYLDGGPGDDLLLGGPGSDHLFAGQGHGRDFLEGGSGDDTLEGGAGPGIYRFKPGDGQDLVEDPNGYHYFEFTGGVNPDSVALYLTGDTDTRFRLEYTASDAVRSEGGFRAYWINGISVDGIAIPLVQRSDLANGIFHDTRWHDVFEGGAGNDTIFAGGWGADVYRFGTGDGEDTISTEESYEPTRMGEISFAAGVDVHALSFSFGNGDAVIAYGGGSGTTDRLTLDTATVASVRDNVLSRFTLVAEADPQWRPVIRPGASGGQLHGSFGADHIIGSASTETIMPGYGDDLVEAGGGPDSIFLNDVYLPQVSGGIGHKAIAGGRGDDSIYTPLHQGLTFHYQPGDGHDHIEYDWSYSYAHPYDLTLDFDQNAVIFKPWGQDTLAFGGGITLADLRFDRAGDDLQIELRDGSGGVRLAHFFHAWDAAADPWSGDLIEFGGPDGVGLNSLLQPPVLAGLPVSPLASLRFTDGSSVELATALPGLLGAADPVDPPPPIDPPEDPPNPGEIIEGTRRRDTLIGTDGDDTLLGYGASDRLSGGAGDDILIGHRGRDTLSGGAGDDTYQFDAGHGRDVIRNNDTNPQSVDTLQFGDIDYDQLWLSRKGRHLVVNVAGSRDEVRISKWFARERHQLDVIRAGDHVLLRDQVDQLVNAMAAFDVPRGVGAIITEQTRMELEPTLAAVWQLTG